MPVTRERLHRTLNPEVVAVIGDKQASGYNWLRSLQTFTGKLYSVQVDPNEIPGIEAMGIENYASLTDIPERVDFAVCAVPRNVAPFIVQSCVDADVGGVTLFTSGFEETGEELGLQLQNKIHEIAGPSGLALIGPNCMGVHIPRLGVRFNRDQPHDVEGNIGFISQSGTHGMNFSLTGAANGLYCSSLISFGNGIILEAADYLDYLVDDERTEVIAMYIEGARDGRRLFDALKSAAARKPVIIWKGGQTEGGGRAIRSHTASLASDQAIWDAVIRQVGAVAVQNLDEMIDVVKATLLTRRPSGNRLGLIAMTGGQSVVLTDAFEKAGWKVPTLTEASYAQLGRVLQHHRRLLPQPARRSRHDRPVAQASRHDLRHPQCRREHRRGRDGALGHVHGAPLARQAGGIRAADHLAETVHGGVRQAVPHGAASQPRGARSPGGPPTPPAGVNPHLPQLRASRQRPAQVGGAAGAIGANPRPAVPPAEAS